MKSKLSIGNQGKIDIVKGNPANQQRKRNGVQRSPIGTDKQQDEGTYEASHPTAHEATAHLDGESSSNGRREGLNGSPPSTMQNEDYGDVKEEAGDGEDAIFGSFNKDIADMRKWRRLM
jgi:hypothetical protein